jgi:MOSC domain-containing protein YiiM
VGVSATVVSVNVSAEHHFSKEPVERADLVAGVGVVGDCHAGAQVKHRSRVRADPTQPNLRQVHLIASELFADLRTVGYEVAPAALGENLTTAGIDLHALPTGTVLAVGEDVLLGLTGLRNPCGQINGLAAGLQRQLLTSDADGRPVVRGGVMAVVLRGGTVRPGDTVLATAPPGAPHPLVRV